MTTLSNKTLADFAHELVCRGIGREQAIRQIAEQYKANYFLIARCFPLSKKSRKRKKTLAQKCSGTKRPREKKGLTEASRSLDETPKISRNQYFRDAERHEKEMRRPFEQAGHLDDY